MKTLALLLLSCAAAQAQPADCVARPTVPNDRMALDFAIPLAGQPGVPKAAAGGYVGLGLRDVPAHGTVCGAAEPALPHDVLHGAPAGDVLRGAPSRDLLMGTPPRGEVFIDTK